MVTPGSCSVKPDNNGGAVTPVDPTPETPVTPTPDNSEPSTPADSVNDYSLQAWSGQEGSEIYHVIFNGNVYKNAWWVGSKDCPRGTSAENPITHGVRAYSYRCGIESVR